MPQPDFVVLMAGTVVVVTKSFNCLTPFARLFLG
jgi:hypothetical protein